MGMKDGTLLRFLLPTSASPAKKGMVKPTFFVHYPVQEPDMEALAAIRKSRGHAYNIELFRWDKTVGPATAEDWVLHTGKPVAITRIVEHGQRIVASSAAGLHLFRLYMAADNEDRRITMALHNNVSFEWRGNLMVILKQTNALQLMQLFECRLEATLAAPASLQPSPPESTVEWNAIAVHDQAIVVVHVDGSRRILELKNPAVAAVAGTGAAEDKARSFLPPTTAATDKKKGKKKNGGGTTKKK
jgi:hypothetical protein